MACVCVCVGTMEHCYASIENNQTEKDNHRNSVRVEKASVPRPYQITYMLLGKSISSFGASCLGKMFDSQHIEFRFIQLCRCGAMSCLLDVACECRFNELWYSMSPEKETDTDQNCN